MKCGNSHYLAFAEGGDLGLGAEESGSPVVELACAELGGYGSASVSKACTLQSWTESLLAFVLLSQHG